MSKHRGMLFGLSVLVALGFAWSWAMAQNGHGPGKSKDGLQSHQRPEPGKPDAPGETPMTIRLRSFAFPAGGVIPRQYTDDGSNTTPEIAWTELPPNAKELALICEDPDAPRPEPWVHWVIYKIPVSMERLPENISKVEHPKEMKGALQGKNSWNSIGYRGPSPPSGKGVHHYHFRLYALDAPIDAGPGYTKDELLKALSSHIIAQGDLVGTYERR